MKGSGALLPSPGCHFEDMSRSLRQQGICMGSHHPDLLFPPLSDAGTIEACILNTHNLIP